MWKSSRPLPDVEEPSVLAPALGICGDVSEADSWLFASCGEDGHRERNELRQLSEVLGGGGQQELIFGSTRPMQAQSIQPEDALQMSEEHLDLLSFATRDGVGLGLCDRGYVGSISKCGDRRVRTLLYEAAHVMLTRYKGQLKLKEWAFAIARRSSMRKARIALARRLAIIMHAILLHGTEFVAA
jgi:transposase